MHLSCSPNPYYPTLPLPLPLPRLRPATWRHLSCWPEAESNFESDAGFVALAEAQPTLNLT